jgi:hypothetical protein
MLFLFQFYSFYKPRSITHQEYFFKKIRKYFALTFEKTAMTSPVQVSQSQKIAMTKPVTIHGDGNYTVAFIMPSGFTQDTLPIPKNDAVQLTSLLPHKVAAIRYSGYFQGERIIKAKQQLGVRLKKAGLEPESDFIVAGYNSPWVPGFLARNEVLIMIKAELG